MIIKGFKAMFRIVKKYFIQQNVSFGKYEDLDLLIKRAIKRLGFSPQCRYGHGSLEFRMGKMNGAGLNNTPRGSPLHEDQEYKCIKCFYTERFGIPMTREEAKEELSLRKGTYLCVPIYREDEAVREDIKKRLIALGYLDF